MESRGLTTETTRLRGDPWLAAAIRAEIVFGRATRTPVDIDNCWALCRQCPHYRGDRCALSDWQTDGLKILDVLCREDLYCRNWAAEPAVRRSPIVRSDAVERVHAAGVKRTQAERRAARRASRGSA